MSANYNPITIEVFNGTIKQVEGDPGAPGEKGDPGDAGKDGSIWLTGAVDPIVDLGKETDMFLNTVTGDIFQKQASVWTYLLNVHNPQNG